MSNINNIIYNNTNYPIGQTEDVELGKVLWENADITQDFEGQTVTLNSDDYDYIIIDFIRRLADNPVYHISFRYEKRCSAHAMVKYDNGNTICDRQAMYVDDTHYLIGGCYTNGTLANSSLIPVKIYGYKNTIPVVAQKQDDIYSTDEQVIGTWIDGKPLYRKVGNISFTEVYSGGDYAIGSLISDSIDYGTITKVMNSVIPDNNLYNTYNATNISHIYIEKSRGGYLKGFTTRTDHLNTVFYVVCEYTKTTDTVGGAE